MRSIGCANHLDLQCGVNLEGYSSKLHLQEAR